MAGARPKPFLQPGHETLPSGAVNAGSAGGFIANESAAAATPLAAPVLAIPLVDQVGTVAAGLSYQIAVGSFTDADADISAYLAELTNGDPLPAWLTFDPATQTFDIAAAAGVVGSYNVRVYAVDSRGHRTPDDFNIILT